MWRSKFILRIQLPFLEPLLVEEDVTASLSVVNSLFCLCLFAKSFSLTTAILFLCMISSGHLYCFSFVCTVFPSQQKCLSIVCSFLICALFFSHLTSYHVSHRLAHLAWHDSAQHSRLLLTRPAGYPLRQLKIWKPCLSPISPSASAGWTGFARVCHWPARPVRPSFGHQVSPLPSRKVYTLCYAMTWNPAYSVH